VEINGQKQRLTTMDLPAERSGDEQAETKTNNNGSPSREKWRSTDRNKD